MKTRQGFVSNSSSSSFVVNLDKLTPEGLFVLLSYPKDIDTDREWHDSWDITVDQHKGVVRGSTNMDNCDLSDYLKKFGVDESLFVWESYS